MTIKRLILAFLTVLAVVKVFFSLGDSYSQPQIQGRLELYQTNLVLHASEYQLTDRQLADQAAIDSFLGKNPYQAAIKQYEKVRQQAITSRTQISNLIVSESKKISTSPRSQLSEAVTSVDEFIAELNLKLGILKASQGQIDSALEEWKSVIEQENLDNQTLKETALVLSNLWQGKILPNTYSVIENNLDGWFRYISLKKLYTIENKQDSLTALNQQEQTVAKQAIVKLAIISGIPILGGMIGLGLLIFLLVQLIWKKDKAILAINKSLAWETPWDWEITWQVIIVGFFFVSQFVLPFLLGIIGLNPTDFNLRFKALYVLVTYLLMTIGGLGVLYFSIKKFFPLPEDWFKFKLFDNWFIWGIGGYLIAIPAVLLVSLINQQIWQGQGGSNPLLYLALQAQDKVALSILFFTASIAAPFFEELMFRGFLLPSLTRYLSVWQAIIISALIFAIAHLSLAEVLPLATLGIILGFVYTRSRNLLSSMLIHSLWNGGTLISLFVLGSSN